MTKGVKLLDLNHHKASERRGLAKIAATLIGRPLDKFLEISSSII